MTSTPSNVESADDELLIPPVEADEPVSDTTETLSTPPAAPPAAEVPGVPAPSPEPAPEPQAPPVDDTRERALAAREQQATQREAAYARQRQEAQVAQNVQAYRSQLEAAGVPTEQVQQLVQREMASQGQLLQMQSAVQSERDVMVGQRNAAEHYSEQYGIPFKDIRQMATPQEMEAAGRAFASMKESKTEIDTLKAEMATLKQAQVPADQVFDDGTGSKSDEMTDEQVVAAYGNPNGSYNDHKRYAEAATRLGYNR